MLTKHANTSQIRSYAKRDIESTSEEGAQNKCQKEANNTLSTIYVN